MGETFLMRQEQEVATASGPTDTDGIFGGNDNTETTVTLRPLKAGALLDAAPVFDFSSYVLGGEGQCVSGSACPGGSPRSSGDYHMSESLAKAMRRWCPSRIWSATLTYVPWRLCRCGAPPSHSTSALLGCSYHRASSRTQPSSRCGGC